MDFRACLKTGVKNEILRLKFGEPGGTLPPRIPRSTPPPRLKYNPRPRL